MAIDTGIYGNQQQFRNSPFEALGQIQQLRAQQQAIQSAKALEDARRQDIAKQAKAEAAQAKFYSILAASKDPDEAQERIRVEAPELYQPFMKQRQELDKTAEEIRQSKLKAKDLQADIAAKGQKYAEPFLQMVEKGGYDPKLFDFALNSIQSHFEDFPADALRQRAAAGPDAIKQIIDGFKSPQQQTADVGAARFGAEKPEIDARAAIAQGQAAGMKDGLLPDQQRQQAQAAAAQAETARANRVNEGLAGGRLGVERSREGREQKQYDATYGSLQGGAGPDDSTANPLAKSIAEYRSPPVSPRSMASGPGKALMEQVMRLNPDYDGTQFPTRQKTRIAFTSGPQSQTLNSLNTAISHLDQFVDVAKALGNGNFQPGNQAYNWLKTTFGDTAPTNFEGIKQIMSGELASAFKKSGATDQEIAGVERAIASKNSAAQLVDYATKIAIPALGSKAATFDEQYHEVMGAKDPWSAVYPEAKRVLSKYGQVASGPKVGDVVTVKGQRVKISAIHSDGTFDGDPVK